MDSILLLIVCCWLIFITYWIVSSFSQKKQDEKPVFTLNNILAQILFAIPYMILIRPEWFYAAQQLFQENFFIESCGLAVCIFGLFICIWARKTLADNWSKNLDFKKGHELIQSGPYRAVRHPIYTGYILMFLGAAIALGTLGSFCAVIILFIGSLLRIKQEEALLTKHFKEKYLKYRKTTNALIPYVF